MVTDTCGGTISGYCASGMVNSASRPAIVVTMAMTMARRGRSTKMAESMAQLRLGDRRQRRGVHRHPGPDVVQALDDDLFAARQPLVDDDVGAAFARRLDALDRRLAVLDHKHIDALLIGEQRCLRNDDLLIRGAASSVTRTSWPSISVPLGFGMVARTMTVSVARSTVTSTKLIVPIWS